MRKIPTLFVRDPDTGLRYVTEQVHPDCQWVMDGEGTPTRKYDGTCVQFDGERWWARREVKPGKSAPASFIAVGTDEFTGKTVGWEPIEQSAFAKFHAEAVEFGDSLFTRDQGSVRVGRVFQAIRGRGWPVGTYELVGPKVNGNPEQVEQHQLWTHATAEIVLVPGLTYEAVRWAALTARDVDGCEGIVWHHEDGRMAKIKAKDFAPVPVEVS